MDVRNHVVGRDPIGKTMVESFAADYPTETNEQIHDRFERAWHGLTGPGFACPLTLADVARWRPATVR